ncbi:glycoside hydrolase family 31 protein [Aspergillus tanneri]|uniref:alpha-glucosidase n=1 Tax=Aspergillus tanneri TaxID=1220188 RepID=A0A5M9MN23_9EURO|nr:uncharacterized protein ATNIH1004_005509 [Aspergillus tanneri]KAA8646834.1 hypothetical protein ATNIH1004_005509 [Aspergillus tanneri]
MWSDIDYMKSYRDFEADPIRFNYTQWAESISRLHASGRHYVPIIDSAIYIPNPENETDAYPVFDRGNAAGAFIMNPDGSPYIGDVWPGYTVFPDWLSEHAEKWWTHEFVEFHKQWAFDGAWVDMSEISSFCVGSCGSGNLHLNPVHPPFALPEAGSASSAISSSMSTYPVTTSSISSVYRTTPTPGVRDVNYPPYAINNFKGPLGVAAISPNATHADGTLDRWMQLSAFFPFYRNHNIIGAINQEAYVWASVIDASKAAMNVRYRFLPYLYILFYHSHVHGHTVMRALAWEFPNDPSLANADRQFLLGRAILVTPVLEPGSSTVDGVFPGLVEGKELWYDWYNGTALAVPERADTTISAPLGHIPVHVRGASILALQQPALTTREVRETPWDILVAFDKNGQAKADLYLDDGVSVVPNATLTMTFASTHRKLSATITQGGWKDQNALKSISLWVKKHGRALVGAWNGELALNERYQLQRERAWSSHCNSECQMDNSD